MDLGFSSGLKIFSEISLRLLSSFGLGWITLNPLRQVLHNHCKSVMQCRLWRMSTSSWFESFLHDLHFVFLHLARGRPHLVSGRSQSVILFLHLVVVAHNSCLLPVIRFRSGVRLQCGCRFYTRCFSHDWRDMMADLVVMHTNNRVLHTFFAAKVPRLILSITNMSKSYTYTVASWNAWVVPFAIIISHAPFDFWIVSFSSWVKSLLLITWSEAPESRRNKFSPSKSHWRRRSIARRTWFKEPMSDLRIWTLRSVHVLVKNPGCFSRCFFHAQSPFDRSFFEVRSVLISLIFGSCLHDSKCGSQFLLFQKHTCSREDGVSLGIGSCHPTESFVFAFLFSSASLYVCLCAQCLRICIHW